MLGRVTKYRESACGAVPVLSPALVSLGNAPIAAELALGFSLEQRVARIRSRVLSASDSFSRTGNPCATSWRRRESNPRYVPAASLFLRLTCLEPLNE